MSDIIKLLPDSVANQIAAGEVIQRPASVIKELVENSIDAGATAVTIVLKDAGRTLIQVVDDGRGMSPTDARMAFERHATSKIRQADDLFALTTMGFRGEALASICAVAQVDVRTMPAGERMGTRLVINGSKVESQQPEVCTAGTNMMVKNLFFNIPARRKFLKKDTVELAAIMREFERLALVNTGVDFSLVHNGVTLHSLRRAPLLRRIADLFGKSIDKQLIPVETDTSIVRVSGYVGLPENGRKRNQLQYLFVNGRNMRHPYFHKAIMQCYEQLLPPDVQPNYFLDFTVDPSTIDVNIHPTKNEIKFENEQAISQILTAAVKESLGRYNAVPSIEFDQNDAPDIPTFKPDVTAAHTAPVDTGYNPFKSDTTDWAKLYDSFAARRDEAVSIVAQSEVPAEGRAAIVGSRMNAHNDAPAPAVSGTPMQGELELEFERAATAVMQLKNRYILSPCRDGLMIVDQQKAHERILYERYMNRTRSGGVQRVIFPEILTLSPAQNAVMEAIAGELAERGFELTRAGDSRWSVDGLPTGISEASARETILAMIDSVEQTGETDSEAINRVMALAMARSSAVKAGQPLTPAEMDRIMGQLLALPAPGLSPDGHRVFTIVTTDDIAKML